MGIKLVRQIIFKSIPENWKKEKSGRKNNTIRDPKDFHDLRFSNLDWFIKGLIRKLYVIIENSETKETFERKVKDVTKFEEIYIITWEA